VFAPTNKLLDFKSHRRFESLPGTQFLIHHVTAGAENISETVNYPERETFDLDKLSTHRTLSSALDTTNIPIVPLHPGRMHTPRKNSGHLRPFLQWLALAAISLCRKWLECTMRTSELPVENCG